MDETTLGGPWIERENRCVVKQDEQRIVQEERLNERILSLTSRVGYLGHVTGYQPIRDEYFLIRLVPDMCH